MKKLISLAVIAVIIFSMYLVACTDTNTIDRASNEPSPESGKTPNTVTITLNRNYEGSETISIKDATPVEQISPLASNPKRYGFNFGGWFFNAACTNPLSKASPLLSDTTLYAKWDAWDEATKESYDAVIEELTLGSYIIKRPQAYAPKEVFVQYGFLLETLQVFTIMNNMPMSPDIMQMTNSAKALRLQLQQVKDPEDGLLYIWDNNIARAEDAEDYDFYMAADNKDFRPFLVPYILGDQENVKGNIIVIAGGGYSVRVNATEGFPVAEYYNSIGYNAFVLQRRVAPYPSSDSSLDLQRSIRYLRYNAEEIGISKPDKIIAIGMSGGGGTIMGTVSDYYGDILPTKAYSNYTPDDVDLVNSDLQAVLVIYGARNLDTDNPNLPPTFMAVGQNDRAALNSIALYKQLNDRGVHVDLHIFADTPHGFVMGSGLLPEYLGGSPINEVDQWPDLAKVFLDIELGYIPRIEAAQ